jgi:RNA polymerase sigma factor (TIGR02999 family)
MRRERSDHTLQPTALVNETYLRLMRKEATPAQDRIHFFATAATVMRRVLVDHARERGATKRGGAAKTKVVLDDFLASATPQIDQWLILDEALNRLAEFAPRQARLVELIFFTGLTIKEAAAMLDPPVGERTAKRDWEAARAWLQAELRKGQK